MTLKISTATTTVSSQTTAGVTHHRDVTPAVVWEDAPLGGFLPVKCRRGAFLSGLKIRPAMKNPPTPLKIFSLKCIPS